MQSGLLGAASLGSPGVDELRWLLPVRPGNTIHPGAEVLTMRAVQIVRRRPPA